MSKVKDLQGKKFNRLTVIKRVENDKNGRAKWLCQCTCGNETVVMGQRLINGKTKSCGCLRGEHFQKYEDISGKKFNMLTVIEPVRIMDNRNRKNGTIKWNCLCECGNTTILTKYLITSGTVKSCGCYKTQKMKNGELHLKHGYAKTRIYRIWNLMKERCKNKNNPSFMNYGGRGITLCKEWESFDPFCKWAMSHGYSDKLSIDRIDVNGDYCPENCRWATAKEQSRNKRTNREIEYNGKTMLLKDWANELNISSSTILSRISKGLPIEKILSREKPKYKKITYNGKTMGWKDWEKEVGISRKVISSRIKYGWTPEEALTTPVSRKNNLKKMRELP